MAEVTREHRHYALSIDGEYDIAKMHDDVRNWLDFGIRPPSRTSPAMLLIIDLEEQAKAIAEAEARGYARCQADVVAWLEAESSARFDECDEHGPDMQDELSALGETLSGIAGAVGKGTHVGAAGKVGG